MNPDVFFENFELLVDAPNGVQKLKELILQLSVMGKLVSSQSEDETVSVLLARIKAEKEKRIREGDIKRDKPLEPIEQNEIPYEIPINWKWVRLGNLVYSYSMEIVDGPFGSNLKASEYVDEGVPIVRIQNVSRNRFLNKNISFVTPEKAKKLARHSFTKGDILITKLGDPVGKACIVPDILESGIIVADLVRLRLDHKFLDPCYITYSINSATAVKQFLDLTTGTTRQRVNLTKIRNLILPIPPLAEQKRIVSKVDELMALCDKLEARRQKKQEIQSKLNSAALDRMLSAEKQEEFEQHWQRICENFDLLYDNPENVEKLRQAILQLAVQGKLVSQNPEDEPASVLIEKIETDIKKTVDKGNLKKLTSIDSDDVFFKLPNSWKWIQLGKLLTFGPKNGYSPKPVDFVTNTKSLTLSATTSGKFRDDCFKYIDEKIDNDSHLWLEESDILVQRGNSIEYVGIAAVYKGPSHNFIYPDLMMKLRVHQNVNTDFLHIALNNRFSRDYFAEKASGTSGSMPKINQNTVINLPIPLPPLAEQKRIVEKVEQLMGLCDELEAKLRKEQKDSEKLMEAVVKGLLEGAATEKTELEEPIPLQVAAIKLK